MSVMIVPTRSETTIVRVANTMSAVGRSSSSALKSAFSPTARREAGEEADDRRDDPDRQRLDDDRPEDLAARGADGPHRGELARALRDGDRKRVEDDERADEERDAGEGEQEVPDEARELADVVLVLLRLGLRRSAPVRLAGSTGWISLMSCSGVVPSVPATEIEST